MRAERAARAGSAMALAAVLACAGLRPAPGGSGPTTAATPDPAPLAEHRGFPAAPVPALADAGIAEVVRKGGGRVALRLPILGEVVLRPGSPFVRYDGNTYQLANAPYRRGGELWIPAELFVRWARSVEGGPDRYAVREGRLVSADAGAEAAGTRADRDGPPDREIRLSDGRSLSGPFVVVIDPGHGGRDPGTRGPRGTLEKHVTLDIARKLRDRLRRAEGIVPVMTRNRDTLVALRDRSRMAISALNRSYDGQRPAGGLFASLHANAVARGHARGFETYFLGRATTERAREVAMRENSAIQYEEEGATPAPDDIRFMLADLDKTQWIIESNRLAGFTQNAMRQRLDSPDRGVKQANYLVLVWASGSMPSVLVETGFLSSSDGERLLRSEAGQERVAEALAEAVEDYHRQYRRQIRATAARE